MALAEFIGFGIKGYRSFGDGSVALIGPMGKIHLVVGQNNVGKSNTLHFMSDVLSGFREVRHRQIAATSLYPGDFDLPEGWGDRPRVISLGLCLTDEVKEALHFSQPKVAHWLSTKAYSRGTDGVVWFDIVVSKNTQQPTALDMTLSADQVHQAEQESTGFREAYLSMISTRIAGTSGSVEHNLRSILQSWQLWQWIPEVVWVDAVRQITSIGDENLRNGQGIIARLAKLERPPRATYAQDRRRFEALEEFVRSVLEDEEARIEIPDEKNTIHVHGRFGMRELGHLGTGVNELILIAMIASINEDKLICIEEPEIHLHPTLQRKLIQYLHKNTNNHYLISTHSAAMLNAEVATITHVEMPEQWSISSHAISPEDLARVSSDLGNRASDIVQSNFIVWVEGPSDRLYVRKWLALHDPGLIEGAHFSIMFYGGVLLSHLTADDDEVDSFINLLQINRNLAMVIDSDRSSEEGVLNDTKERVISELDRIGAPVWVTQGYTIENYIPIEEINESVAELYPTKSYNTPTSSFVSPLGNTFDGSTTKPSKTTVARYIIELQTSWEALPQHLRENIVVIAENIREANGLVGN